MVIYGADLPTFFEKPRYHLDSLATTQGASFVVTPLFALDDEGTPQACVVDADLLPHEWTANVVGKANPLDDLESDDPILRAAAEELLRREDSLSSHLGLQALLLPPPPKMHSPNYARVLNSMCKKAHRSSFKQYWVIIPYDPYRDKDRSWLLWDNLRHLIDHHPKVHIVLVQGDQEDLWANARREINRWVSEPVRAIWLKVAQLDMRDYREKMISRRILSQMLELPRMHVILNSPNKHNEAVHLTVLQNGRNALMANLLGEDAEDNGEEDYPGDLRDRAMMKQHIEPYRDLIQEPLQPLMDNLESATYDTFEKDPFKYSEYEEALYQALEHRKKSCKLPAQAVVIVVVGAGRGPLVSCAIRAAARAGVAIKITAVEKNENAMITLEHRVEKEEFWKDISLYHGDMRHWNPKEQADILVSELLGSWGDNELSPECLDGAMHCLKDSGISIPSDYTSYVAPISAAKVWMSARDVLHGHGLDTPLVVNLHSQRLFTFQHIIDNRPIHQGVPQGLGRDNERYKRSKTLSFKATSSGTVHGLAGFFEASLYAEVSISIRPETRTRRMFSWFPMFIPFTKPISVREGQNIEVSIWRCADKTRVWYEWCLSEPTALAVQNCCGSGSSVGVL
eukprot:GSChrysophyteH1.ASY1.ANO1.3015.1 assembled CDS